MAVDTMKASLVDPKSKIDMYGYKEVTSTSSFVSSTTMLDPEGLFSEEIFGKQGTPERKTMRGYINLNCVIMNPHAYYALSRIKRAVASNLKDGLGRYYIDKDGEIQAIDINKETVPETALTPVPGTGFEWLRDNWDKISWKTTKQMSAMAKTFRSFLKTRAKDEIFWEQILVMPAFYRDIDPKSNKRNKINTYYSTFLRLAKVIKASKGLDFFDDPDTPSVSSAQIKLQDQVNEFYNFFMSKLGGTHGFANENILGKATDYGARLVISTPDFNTNHYKDAEADFFHSSTPLSVAINCFAPFIIYGITQFIKKIVSGSKAIAYWDIGKNQMVSVEVDPTYMAEFTPKAIRKYMDNYKNSKAYRCDDVTIKGVNNQRIPIAVYFNDETQLMTGGADVVARYDEREMIYHMKYLTWCELFYIVAEDTLKDKVIYNTRYPLTTYNNTYCSLMNIVPANQYKKVFFDGVQYNRYPILDIKNDSDIDRLFTDTMRMCSVYLAALGADYDGDQISTQGLFSNEGNKEAVDHMKSVSNIIGVNNNSVREFPHVVNHGIYGLTYKTKKPS